MLALVGLLGFLEIFCACEYFQGEIYFIWNKLNVCVLLPGCSKSLGHSSLWRHSFIQWEGGYILWI